MAEILLVKSQTLKLSLLMLYSLMAVDGEKKSLDQITNRKGIKSVYDP